MTWGDFGYGWRGSEGSPSDGAKIGRQVLATTDSLGILGGLGWTWDYDNAVRLTEAVPGAGSVHGRAPPSPLDSDRFTFRYGEGDELLERLREATAEVDTFDSGDYGRITARDGAASPTTPSAAAWTTTATPTAGTGAASSSKSRSNPPGPTPTATASPMSVPTPATASPTPTTPRAA